MHDRETCTRCACISSGQAFSRLWWIVVGCALLGAVFLTSARGRVLAGAIAPAHAACASRIQERGILTTENQRLQAERVEGTDPAAANTVEMTRRSCYAVV